MCVCGGSSKDWRKDGSRREGRLFFPRSLFPLPLPILSLPLPLPTKLSTSASPALVRKSSFFPHQVSLKYGLAETRNRAKEGHEQAYNAGEGRSREAFKILYQEPSAAELAPFEFISPPPPPPPPPPFPPPRLSASHSPFLKPFSLFIFSLPWSKKDGTMDGCSKVLAGATNYIFSYPFYSSAQLCASR